MELKGLSLTFVFVCLQEIGREVSAATCGYISSNGVRRYTFCMQKCCEEDQRTYSNVCCPYDDNKEVYMGAGMATLIVLSVFAVCFTYICCRHRIRRLQNQRRQNNGRRTPQRRDNQNDIPTVSSQVEPIQPPAYDSLPPPYYMPEPGTSDKKQELPPFDVGPPPAYSP